MHTGHVHCVLHFHKALCKRSTFSSEIVTTWFSESRKGSMTISSSSAPEAKMIKSWRSTNKAMQTQNFQPKRWILPQSMSPLKRRKVSNWVLHAVYHVSAYNTIRHYTTTWHFKEPIPVDQNVCHSEIPQKLDQEANKIELHSTKWKKMIWNTPSSTFPNSLRFKYRCSGKGNKVRSRFQGPKCPVQSLPLEHRDIVYTYTYAYMDCKYGRTAQFCWQKLLSETGIIVDIHWSLLVRVSSCINPPSVSLWRFLPLIQ